MRIFTRCSILVLAIFLAFAPAYALAQTGGTAGGSTTTGSSTTTGGTTGGTTGAATTNGTAATSGDFPVNYPNTWLRLNRTRIALGAVGLVSSRRSRLFSLASVEQGPGAVRPY